MNNALLVWALVIGFGVLLFVGVYLLSMKKEADKYVSLKTDTKKSLKTKRDLLVNKLSIKQLNTLINALKK